MRAVKAGQATPAQRLGRGGVRLLEVAIVACLAVMAVLVFGNVVLRYAFDSGIAVSEELSRLLFVWLIFLGAILATVQQAHIGFDSLVQRMPPRGRKLLALGTGLLMLWASGMFLQGGWAQTVINLDNRYPVLGISYAWLYGVALVFGAAMAVVVLVQMWRGMTGPHGGAGTQDMGDQILDDVQDVATQRPSRPGESP